MGKLAIRKVIYDGKKYTYESPELGDGIVILEGPNGHGKSTFMNLIYYGLGGKVESFNKNDDAKKKHTEIYGDEDNYIELIIEIGEERYQLTRQIGDNRIFIVDSEENVLETCVTRIQSDQDTVIFSDWILDKLDIQVFDIIQGTRNYKLNFSNLMRLIYHDQETNVDKIYKEADNSNFVSDSLEVRKAIFEVLLGKTYNDYYAALGTYKIMQKEFDKSQATMESYDDFLSEILSDDLYNVVHLKSQIDENQEMLEKVILERNVAINKKNSASDIFVKMDEEKKKLWLLEQKKSDLQNKKSAINQSIDKILFLINDAEKELKEIEKIRFVNKKLKLFTPNTCPYCLREVEREKGKCICGNDIDEDQYENFFYTSSEYLDILKVKKKAIQSLNSLLEKKNGNMSEIIKEICDVENSIDKQRRYIQELSKDITSEYNSAYQIILTTGMDTYPKTYKEKVFMNLNQNQYLLKEK